MLAKPDHLGPEFAAQFGDAAVAHSYHTRPPYPSALFERLVGLLPAGERSVLDLGCGTGDLALGLVGRVDRVELVEELARRGLFEEAGRATIGPVGCRQSLDDYVESFHTRNGFSRQRMSAAAAASFDAAVRRLVRRYHSDDRIEAETEATMVWGVPRRPTRQE